MKHFYLLCGMIMLIHGSMAMEIGPLPSESDIMHLNPDEDVSPLTVPAVVGVIFRVAELVEEDPLTVCEPSETV